MILFFLLLGVAPSIVELQGSKDTEGKRKPILELIVCVFVSVQFVIISCGY